MAEKYSFFPDIEYTVFDWAKYFASFIGNGVFPNPSTNLQVISNNEMTVTVKAGKAFIDGYFYVNESDLILPIENADGVLKRKDNIVIRLDKPLNKITAKVIKGEFSNSATAPEVLRTVDYYDLKIAEIAINNGAISITQANITDTRLNSSVCGIVTQTVQTIDTTTLYNQIQTDLGNFKENEEASFIAWVESLKEILNAETAGNLLALINNHKADTTVHVTIEDKANWESKAPGDHTHTSLVPISTVLNSSNVYNNKYAQIAEINITAQYGYVGFTLEVILGGHSWTNNEHLELDVWVKCQNPLGQDGRMSLLIDGKHYMTDLIEFYLLESSKSASGNTYGLYAFVKEQFTDANIYLTGQTSKSGSVVFKIDSAYIDALPIGRNICGKPKGAYGTQIGFPGIGGTTGTNCTPIMYKNKAKGLQVSEVINAVALGISNPGEALVNTYVSDVPSADSVYQLAFVPEIGLYTRNSKSDSAWSSWNAPTTIETGTWTPTLTGSDTAGAFTYSDRQGTYIKIGSVVHVTFIVTVSGVTTVPTGIVKINGLPFAALMGNQGCTLGYSDGGAGQTARQCSFGAVQNSSYYPKSLCSNVASGFVGHGLVGLNWANSTTPHEGSISIVAGTGVNSSLTLIGSATYRI